MDLHELRAALVSRGVDERAYVLDGLTCEEPVEGAVYVMRTAHRWEVGVQERGVREPLADFPDEQSACAFALAELNRPGDLKARRWWLRWT